MNILNINGSPKGSNSNTNIMVQAVLKGLESADTKIVNIFLTEKKIEYCKGCYSCWFKTPGKCIINDPMEEILCQMNESDILIIGSPVYFNNISGLMKVFFDRLMPMGKRTHKNNENKKAASFIMVSNCGFSDKSQFDVLSLWIKNITRMLQADLLAEFYTPNGKVLTLPNSDQTAQRNNYLEYLTACGKDILNNQKLSDNLKALSVKGLLEF